MFEKALILNPICGGALDFSPNPAAELLALAKDLKAKVFAQKLDHHSAASQLLSKAFFLQSFGLSTLETEVEARAFWINVYNSLIIHAMLELELQQNVFEVPKFFKRASYQISGEIFSLDVIEHGILRANRGHPIRLGLPQILPLDSRRRWVLPLDPRIHFALNCGALSCPPIRAYDATQLDAQLELATRAFVQGHTRLSDAKDAVRLSRLFLWYARDFGASWPERLRWISQYCEGELEAALQKDKALARRFDDYDWSLA